MTITVWESQQCFHKVCGCLYLCTCTCLHSPPLGLTLQEGDQLVLDPIFLSPVQWTVKRSASAANSFAGTPPQQLLTFVDCIPHITMNRLEQQLKILESRIGKSTSPGLLTLIQALSTGIQDLGNGWWLMVTTIYIYISFLAMATANVCWICLIVI